MSASFYLLEKLVGKGSYSLIYKVSHDVTGAFALKKTFFSCPSAIRCALRERQAYRRMVEEGVNSPLLPILYHAFMYGGLPTLITNLSSGLTLWDLINAKYYLIEKEAKFYLAEVICALEKLHQLQIVHLDVKAENILLQDSGHIMLSDFDRSVDLSLNDEVYRQGRWGGALAFIAPEIMNKVAITTKADVWNLGMLACLMLSNEPRMGTMDADELLEMARSGGLKIKHFYSLSPAAQYFLKACLQTQFIKRPEISDLKDFPYFKDVNWEDAGNCRLRPPFKISEIPENCDLGVNPYDKIVLKAVYGEYIPRIGRKLKIVSSVGGFSLEKHTVDQDELIREGFTKERITELFSDYYYYRS
ncbi:hypothetical protein Aperf_G00000013451 [Anoplocephala perfoliata]